MSRVGDKEKVPDGYDLPHTGRMLQPMSYERLVASWIGHILGSFMTGVLHTAVMTSCVVINI